MQLAERQKSERVMRHKEAKDSWGKDPALSLRIGRENVFKLGNNCLHRRYEKSARNRFWEGEQKFKINCKMAVHGGEGFDSICDDEYLVGLVGWDIDYGMFC